LARRLSEAKSFEDIVSSPRIIWGLDAEEVSRILGSDWEKHDLNFGEGWKFLKRGGGDAFVSYTTGNNHHPNSTYYKISSGVHRKIKVVDSDYVPTLDDKARIIRVDEY